MRRYMWPNSCLPSATVLIDAAREHGTYQNIRREVTIGGEPFRHDLAGGVELKSASIEYRRKTERGATSKGNAR